LEEQYRAAYQALRRLWTTRKFNEADLQLIELAARNKYAALWENAVRWLQQLSPHIAAVVTHVEAMSHAKEPHVRFNALCALSRHMPREQIVSILLRAIDDKSANVRWKAVEQCRHHRVMEAIPLISQRLMTDKSKKVRSSLAFELPLLERGYEFRGDANGGDLTVASDGGIRSGRVSSSELAQRDIGEIAREWKAQMDQSRLYVQFE
jgi:hypothetical protein